MTLRIGIVKYINAFPFYLPYRLGELKSPSTFQFGIPSQVNTWFREGTIDLALTSCTEYFDSHCKGLPSYGIAAQNEILSVNLYLRTSLNKARIGVTHHSATSVSLLKVLCRFFWKATPDLIPFDRQKPLEEYGGILLIGDEALSKSTLPGYETVDLGKAWNEATSLPFVFALFSQKENRKLPEEEIEAALQWSENNRALLVSEAEKQSGLPPSLINRYYDLCRYRLREQEREGLYLFQTLRERVSEIFT